ncbi:MAG: flagellar basal-body MS-ring/collar protein FliF [Pseudomonadota bacterium]
MKFVEDWRHLSTRNQVIAIATLAAVLAALLFLARAASVPRMTLLYAGLDAASSGEILEALEAMDVASEVRGDAIYVAENRRDSIRMSLARDGLPRQGQAGFELLDELNGFATTSDMFDAAYWRAKEGELARTILATPGVKSARVHIAAPKRSAFSRHPETASAVVTIVMARGRLGLEQAAAMRFVVALAVPGLAPEQVAVIDSGAGVVLAPGDGDPAAATAAMTNDREQDIERDLIGLLEARVGAGNARVKVAIDVSHEQETYFERVLDPEKRILTDRESSEIEESGAEGAGAVTVASNLPEGDATPQAAPAQSKRSETTETTKFDVSETRRERVSAPGALRRVQVAVLINEARKVGEDGDVSAAPRSPEEIDAIRKLVAAAIGFDEARGDVVTIESLAFDEPAAIGEERKANPVVNFLSDNAVAILQLVIPAIVSLVLALFVLRPILASGASAKPEPVAALGAPPPPVALAPAPPPASPVEEMRRIASERRAASAAVLKDWLEKQESAA